MTSCLQSIIKETQLKRQEHLPLYLNEDLLKLAKTIPKALIILNYIFRTQETRLKKQQRQSLDQEGNQDVGERYFFHSLNWKNIKKKQMNQSLRQEGVRTAAQSPVTNENLDRFLRESKLQKLQKIESKQRRDYNKRSAFVSPQKLMSIEENQFNKVELMNKQLENHVDGEIFLPKNILDEATLQQLYNEKEQDANQKLSIQNGRLMSQQMPMRKTEISQETKINQSLLAIEQRLGLKKKSKFEEINQIVNLEKTKENIELIGREIIEVKNSKCNKASQRSSRQPSTIIKGANRYSASSQISKPQITLQYKMNCEDILKHSLFKQESIVKDLKNRSIDNHVNFHSLRCHGCQNQKSQNTKQKLIERLFEKPKEVFLQKINRGQDQDSQMETDQQILKRKEVIKQLLLDILDHEKHFNSINQSIDLSQNLTERMSSIETQRLRNHSTNQSPRIPEFLQIIMQYDPKGNPQVADDAQFKHIEKLFNAWYNYNEPRMNEKALRKQLKLGKKKTKLDDSGKSKEKRRRNTRMDLDKSDDSFKSYLDSEFYDEDKLINMRTDALDNAKFSVYNKYLNVLLLKTGDPFVAQQYNNYLRIKRKGKNEEKQKNFYERMQQDVHKRKVEDSTVLNQRSMIQRFTTNFSSISGIQSNRNSSKGDTTPMNVGALASQANYYSRQQAQQGLIKDKGMGKSKDSHEYVLHDVPENIEEFDNFDQYDISLRAEKAKGLGNHNQPNIGNISNRSGKKNSPTAKYTSNFIQPTVQLQVKSQQPRRLSNAFGISQNKFSGNLATRLGNIKIGGLKKKNVNIIDQKIIDLERELHQQSQIKQDHQNNRKMLGNQTKNITVNDENDHEIDVRLPLSNQKRAKPIIKMMISQL
eukprot:403361930